MKMLKYEWMLCVFLCLAAGLTVQAQVMPQSSWYLERRFGTDMKFCRRFWWMS